MARKRNGGERVKYLNKEQKELVLSMLACATCLQIASEHEMLDSLDAEELARMGERIKEICEQATKDVEQGSLRAMYNTAENAHIALIPKTNPKAKGDYKLCEVGALMRLVTSSILDCGCCVLTGNEIKKCATRNDLMECNVDFVDTNAECPYRVE